MADVTSFHVTMEFVIERRIAWDGEADVLRDHLDAVTTALDAHPDIAEWRLVGDLSAASLELQIVVAAVSTEDAGGVARRAVGAAIRDAGAMHDGLLSIKEEAAARINANAWHGLRTPRWLPRGVRLSPLES